MVTWQHLYFLSLFFVYSIMDIEKKEVSWNWLFFGIISVGILLSSKFMLFLAIFALFYLIYQFINIGGADIVVLAMISAILGIKLFIMYLVVLSIISLILAFIKVVFQKSSKNIAFLPYLTIAYGICLVIC